MTPAKYYWKKIKNGECWHLLAWDGKVAGFVRSYAKFRWDAYIVTEKKWPDHDQCVTRKQSTGTFWSARYDVEWAIRSQEPA